MLRRSHFLMMMVAALCVAASTVSAEPEEFVPCPSGPPTEESLKARFLAIDVSGEWRMFLPAGWEQAVTIDRLGEGRYYVRPPYVMEGTYVQDGTRLTRVSKERLEDGAKPESELPRNEMFAWQLRSPHLLTLIDDPESRSIDYSGATLFRGRETEKRETKARADEATPKEAEPAPGTADRPFAIDIPETELDVRIFPGQKATRLPSGDLQFAMTVRNESKETIEFDLPRNPGDESSVLARVRVLEPRPADCGEDSALLLHVYRAGPKSESSTVTVRPGEEAKLDIRLDWKDAVKASNRRLQQQRKCEILLTMTFMAEGRLQHLTGPRGNVVTIDALKPVR